METACFLWRGAIDVGGYARLGGAQLHRWIFERAYGPIPPGLCIDHVCHSVDPTCVGGVSCLHRRCLNPLHLEAVTPKENSRRQAPARKTHCKRGHEFTPENTYIRRNGRRQCRECNAIAALEYWNRNKAERNRARRAA